MTCPNCGANNAPLKKCCYRCGEVLSGYAINNVTGECGYRNPDGSFSTTKETTMDNKTKDLLWASLSKEERKRHRDGYKSEVKALSYNSGFNDALESVFGKHNLTSDTEPRELLFVDKKKVGDLLQWANECTDNTEEAYIVKNTIECLFGDKCLPDEPNTPNSGELIEDTGFGGMSLTPPSYKLEVKPDKQPSVQVEPKKFFESDYSIGDKVIVCISSIGEPRKEVVTLLCHYQSQCEYNDYAKTWVIQTQNGQTFQCNEEHFEPYTEPETKDNMEEKELNLAELLAYQDLSGMYSPIYGKVRVTDITCDNILLTSEHSPDNTIELSPDGRFSRKGDCLLFPSRALYEKYPLDAKKAWEVWAESRKPKRWRADHDELYWFVEDYGEAICAEDCRRDVDDERYEVGNYFRTEEEAQQAAEAVRECLLNFHAKNNK